MRENNKVFYAKMSDVRNAFLAKKPMYLLLYNDANVDINDSLPSVAIALLQDYKDVFPEEMPLGLPPIRGIEHQIDFLPSATIPNRPGYRSNPEETIAFSSNHILNNKIKLHMLTIIIFNQLRYIYYLLPQFRLKTQSQ